MASLYDAAFPLYLRMLRNLDAILDKAIAYADEKGVDVQELVDTRLATDMHSLVGQVQLASDAAKGGAARLAGVDSPSFPDTEKTMAELKARIAKTIAFVETIKPEQVDGDEARTIEVKLPNRTLTFTAKDFLFNFSLPNFLFHITTAYGVLRHAGVPLAKMDYLTWAKG
jgi:hypothetical protein